LEIIQLDVIRAGGITEAQKNLGNGGGAGSAPRWPGARLSSDYSEWDQCCLLPSATCFLQEKYGDSK
jgi:hypothetical protein